MSQVGNLDNDTKNFRIKKKIIIEPGLFYSEAFKSLSASAMITLMRCLQKRNWEYKKVYGKKYPEIKYLDDGFIFPYAEAAFLGIGTTQHWKNLKKLVELGFIDIVHQGGWYQKNEKQKDYSVYKISDRWKLYGQPGFIKQEKARVLQPDFYITKNLEKKSLRATSRKRSGLLHDSEDDRGKQAKVRLHKSEVDKETQDVQRGLKTQGASGRS